MGELERHGPALGVDGLRQRGEADGGGWPDQQLAGEGAAVGADGAVRDGGESGPARCHLEEVKIS